MSEKKNVSAKVTAFGAAGVFFAFLLKFKVAALALLKAGWIFKTTGTMFLSFGVYAVAFGWQWALTIIGVTFVHEMGHYAYMQAKGMRPKAPVFVPFFGAYVAMTKLPDDPVMHAWSAFAGPLAGGAAAALLYYLGVEKSSPMLISAASWGFILNLLQLVPVRPFDGGFIAECISKWLSLIGVAILLFVAFSWQSPLLIIISLGAIFSTVQRFRKGDTAETVPIALSERVTVTALYFWLAWALAYFYSLAQEQLKTFSF